MLKTRILTALVLLAVLLPVLYSNNFTAFAVVATAFFGAAIWETFRLFNPKSGKAVVVALFWTAAFAWTFFFSGNGASQTFWPDFSKASLDEAITSYQDRERRFGQTGDQVAQKSQ